MYLFSVLEQFNLFYIPLFYFFKVFFGFSIGVSFLINNLFVNFILSLIYVNDVIGREIFLDVFFSKEINFITLIVCFFTCYKSYLLDFDFLISLTFGYINNMIFGYLIFFFIKNIVFFGTYNFSLFINRLTKFIRLKFLLKFQELIKMNFGLHFPFVTKSLVFYPYFLTIFLVIFFSNFQGLIFADLYILLF